MAWWFSSSLCQRLPEAILTRTRRSHTLQKMITSFYHTLLGIVYHYKTFKHWWLKNKKKNIFRSIQTYWPRPKKILTCTTRCKRPAQSPSDSWPPRLQKISMTVVVVDAAEENGWWLVGHLEGSRVIIWMNVNGPTVNNISLFFSKLWRFALASMDKWRQSNYIQYSAERRRVFLSRYQQDY